ncbi:MAG: rSAM/selenodomain-associated transferase 2 [Marinoscillum sp.]|jgi:rSAM/selenodomain-associated transferase 2
MISIIIPTLNEAEFISNLLQLLTKQSGESNIEVIIVDGGSTDGTLDIISNFTDIKVIHSEVASRPVQLNLGAQVAQFNIFYFLHADVIPPNTFYEDIVDASKRSSVGGYRYRFDSGHWLLKINAWFTRFPMMWCRGGDQSMFIKKSLFDELGGYNEYYSVLEDFDIIRRAKEHYDYFIIAKDVIVSPRKYVHNGYFKVQMVNLKAFRMYRNGVEPDKIRAFYKKALSLKNY